MFAPLIEKLWAKINGSYERIAGGWQHESLRVLSGAPAYDYLTSSYTSDEIWTLISNATNLKYIVGCGTPGTGDDSVRSTTGLAASHAYAILGTYKIKNSESPRNIESRIAVQQDY